MNRRRVLKSLVVGGTGVIVTTSSLALWNSFNKESQIEDAVKQGLNREEAEQWHDRTLIPRSIAGGAFVGAVATIGAYILDKYSPL